jgi:hypothetical protein
MLFIDVPKIKVEISHRDLARIAHGFDISDDCGTKYTLAGARFSINPE